MGVLSVVDATGEVYTPGPDFTNNETDYTVRYFVDSNHNKELDASDTRAGASNGSDQNGTTAPGEVGNYFIVALNATAYSNLRTSTAAMMNGEGYIAQYFEITNRDLSDAVAVSVINQAEGTYVEGFTYNTQPQNVGFAVDGELLDPATDYDVTFNAASVTNAGDYTATLTGKGAYDGSNASVRFTVDKLDLSTASFNTPAVEASDTSSVSPAGTTVINGIDGFTVSDLISAEDIDSDDSAAWGQVRYYGPDGRTYTSEDGSDYESWANAGPHAIGGYEFYAKANAESGNVIGDCYFTVDVVTEVVQASDFLYDGVTMNDASDPEGELDGAKFDLSKGQSYDASEFSVRDHRDDPFTVSLSTEDGNVPGTHTVVVEMTNPGDYSIGGSSWATFTVVGGEIDTSEMDAIAIVDGVNVPFGTDKRVTYTGEPVVPSITLTCGDETLVEGEDYTVTYTDAAGNAVDEMVNAGTYTVAVASDYYTITDPDWFTVTIAPRELTTVTVKNDVVDSDDVPGILYTGSEIDVQLVGTYEVPVYDPATQTEGAREVSIVLDPSWYLVSGLRFMAPDAESYVPAESVLAAGDYLMNVSKTAACVNYDWDADNNVAFQVVTEAFFADVAADQWYAEEVNHAAKNGYINGVGDTKLFMPDNDISRAELAQVMFNMAGQSVRDGVAYPTPFSDVPELAWFAQPVSWATEAGIVTGMGDTGTFAPYDNATREQVATMFYRYAKAQGMDVSGAADLSGYADDEAVSGWAEQAVAWAVEAGIFGQGTDVLRPSDPISRAEVAAMAVRLQPEKVEAADPLA